MRKRFQILNLVLLFIFLNFGTISVFGFEEIVERSRGFIDEKCYLHLAELDCKDSKEACIINLFAGANRLAFKTKFRDTRKLVNGSRIRDFTFKLVKFQGYLEAELIKMDHIDESKKRLLDQYGLANEVPCTNSKIAE